MKRTVYTPVCILILCLSAAVAAQRSESTTPQREVTIPHLIKFSGSIKDANGLPRVGTLGISFRLYGSREGGDPLWTESQVVTIDEQGQYSIYLGASEKAGIPLELFSTEKARWLGVQVQGQEEEQARVLLVAVPYALKASDADTVGGKPLSSLVTYEDLAKLQETDPLVASNETAGSSSDVSETKQAFSLFGKNEKKLASSGGIAPVFAASGTTGQIAKFINSTDLGDSVISESGGNIGIGTVPVHKLHVANTSGHAFLTLQAPAGSQAGFNLSNGTAIKYQFLRQMTNDHFVIYDVTRGSGLAMDLAPGGDMGLMTGGGNIGIGTTSPGAKLHVVGSGAFGGPGVTSPSGTWYYNYGVDPSNNLTITAGNPNKSIAVGNFGNLTLTSGGGNGLFIQHGTGNVGIGTTSPTSKLAVVGDIESSTGFKIGGVRILSNQGVYNTFVGDGAGQANTGGGSAFFGAGAGYSNTTGEANNFFGAGAGYSNTTGKENNFFGQGAGYFNTTGKLNSFFGDQSGANNTTGNYNAFLGASGYSNTTGSGNSFVGRDAGRLNAAGNNNSFFGFQSGYSNTSSGNSFFGYTSGYSNTTGISNAFFGTGAGYANTIGSGNTFVGANAGHANATYLTYAGDDNSFFGYNAGYLNVAASGNSFFGKEAGYQNTYGGGNAFFGIRAGYANTTGGYNSFFGEGVAGANTAGGENSFFGSDTGDLTTTGSQNSFFGRYAGYSNTTGSLNTALGYAAGYNAAGSNNVHINNEGDAADSNTIRIGIVTASTNYPNEHTQTFIGGIANANVTGSAVLVSSTGQLGIATSSRRFKEDIRDMGDASTALLRLRPVTFRYKPEYAAGDRPLEYGLIAEEVAEVYPELVQYDKDGKPFTVEYQVLSSMLLNEVQKQYAELERKDEEIKSLNARLTALERIMERTATQSRKNRQGR